MSLEDKNTTERREYYSRIASQYEQCAVKETGYIAHEIVPSRLLFLLASKQSPICVLDLGCGTGLASIRFIERGDEVTGMDFSQGMLEECKKRNFKQLICQNINEALNIQNSSFDAVICLGAFEFVENASFVINQVFAKLKAGGIFAFTVPTSSEPCERLKIKHFTANGIADLLDKTGFKVIYHENFFGWETGHLQALDGKTKGNHEKVEYAAFYAQKPNTK